MERTPFKHPEKKVIINVPPSRPAHKEGSRDSSPTIVSRAIPQPHKTTIAKTRLAVGIAIGVLAAGGGVILVKGLNDQEAKITAPSSVPVKDKELLATNAPVATNTVEIPDLQKTSRPVSTAAPAETVIPADTAAPVDTAVAAATAIPTADPSPASQMTAVPTAVPSKTWTMPKPQPKKSGIMREVPF